MPQGQNTFFWGGASENSVLDKYISAPLKIKSAPYEINPGQASEYGYEFRRWYLEPVKSSYGPKLHQNNRLCFLTYKCKNKNKIIKQLKPGS